MAAAPLSNLSASDVARGVTRLLAQAGFMAIPEVPLPNGRRADLLALDAKGQVMIVEIKVSRADLHGDRKWPEYWDWCDYFYWALADGLDASVLDTQSYLPEKAGLIIADRYGAAMVRDAVAQPMAAARRKAESLRIARLAMRRLMHASDPDLAVDWALG